MAKTSYRWIGMIGLIIIVIVIMAVQLLDHNKKIVHAPTPPTVTYQILKPVTLPLIVSTYGHVVSPTSVTLRAQASGTILSIAFQPGQKVKKGQVLFTLQSNDTTSQLGQLQAALSIAKQTYDRNKKMADEYPGAVAKIHLLKLQSAYEQALAQYNEAKAMHTVVAPISGRLSDTNLAVGDFVNSGDLLVYIIDQHAMQVKYQLPSQYANQVSVGQKVIFYPRGSQTKLTTQVSYVAPLLNANNYNITLRADLKNSTIPLNTFGRVEEVINPNFQTIAVPQTSTQTDAKGFYVYILAHNKVTKQYFTPGQVTKSGLIMVKTGLKQGAKIITSNIANLTAGQTVKAVLK